MDYCNYHYPEYDGPVPTPPIPNQNSDQIKIKPAIGPVPTPVDAQEKLPKAKSYFKKLPILSPLPPKLPPMHTQIQPRCFTCNHFEMCGYKKDYLKTAKLIQHCLGAPQRDYELTTNYITIPDFIGFSIVNQEKYFPKEITFDNEDKKGHLFLSKFNGINYVNVVYMIRNTYVLLQLKYSSDSQLYELKKCSDAFYDVKYELNKESLEEIQTGLLEWREVIINTKMPPPPPRKDIINTTHFSVNLNCDMYDWNKMSYDDAIKKLLHFYPYGVPIDGHEDLYHIATYHVEPNHVDFAPLFVKEECHRKPPKRRDDL